MSENDIVLKAREFAIRKHKGQFRRNGEPYVNHPFRVAEFVLKFNDNPRTAEFVAAALLHDILEDTDTRVSELRDNFGELVALLVVQLTVDRSISEVIGKTKYLSNKFSDNRCVSGWALVIKLADRLDNVSDLEVMGSDFAKRYKLQTLEFLRVIESRRKLTIVHVKLIRAIKKKLLKVEV